MEFAKEKEAGFYLPLLRVWARSRPWSRAEPDKDTGFGIRYQACDLVLSHHRSQIGALGRSVDRQKDCSFDFGNLTIRRIAARHPPGLICDFRTPQSGRPTTARTFSCSEKRFVRDFKNGCAGTAFRLRDKMSIESRVESASPTTDERVMHHMPRPRRTPRPSHERWGTRG